MKRISVASVSGVLLGMLLVSTAQAQGSGVRVATDRETCLQAAGASVPSATYTPGVDAYGNAVAPAEGDGGGVDSQWLAESVTIVLSVDMAKRYGIGNNGASFGAEAPLGQVTLRNGQVYVNGRPLQANDQAAFLDACNRLPMRRK